MSLRLDFVSRRHPTAVWGWLLLALGATYAAWAGWRYEAIETALAVQQARVDRLAPVAERPDPRKARDDDPATMRAHRLLGTDWQALLQTLERNRPADIALLHLAADASAGSVAIYGKARNPDAMLAYLKTLEGMDVLSEVSLTRHGVVDEDGEHSVDFLVHADWRRP